MKIVLVSDLHIRNYSRHNEYKEFFELIGKEIANKQPDFVIFLGDLAHSKTNLSPDYFEMAKDFLRRLKTKKCKIIIIPGNHDCAERNLERLDAISPLMSYFDSNDYIYLKESKYDYKPCDGFVIRPFSILDKENWRYDREGLSDDEVLIGLFHGPLKNAKTDLGFIFDHADDWHKFKNLDFLFCGDIHARFSYDDEGRFISVGNPIQQDFGEKPIKGLILFDIKSRKDFSSSFIEIPNLYPFISLNVGTEGFPSLPTCKMENVRFKIISDRSSFETQEYINFIKKMNPQYKSLVTVNKIKNESSFVDSKSRSAIGFEDFIKDRRNFESLCKLHSKYLSLLSHKEIVANWRIKNLSWSNLFSYGEGNFFDFENLNNQSVGIFGANYSGKTSLIDIICFSIFGSWTKQFVKSINFIHDNKPFAHSLVTLEVNNKIYSIERKLEKIKKGKRVDCVNTVNFKCITDGTNLNGDIVPETQNNIEKLVGSMSDFLLTSISTQFNNFSLIDEKNTKRKQFFSRILGIEIYEQISSLVKEDIKTLELEIKQLGLKNTDESIIEYEKIINDAKKNEIEILSKIAHYGKILEEQLCEFREQKALFTILDNQKKELEFLEKENKNNEQKQKILIEEIQSIHPDEVIQFNPDLFMEKKKENLDLSKQIMECEFGLRDIKSELLEIENLESKRNSVPCENKFPTCRFLINLNEIKTNDKQLLIQQINKLSSELSFLQDKMKQSTSVLEELKKTEKLFKKHSSELKILEKKKIELQTIQSNDFGKRIADLRSTFDISTWALSESRLKSLEMKIQLTEGVITDNKAALRSNDVVISIHSDLVKNILEKQNQAQRIRAQLDLLTEYGTVVGKNGIIMAILSNCVPAIASLMNDIIANIAQFSIEIEIEDDKNLEIYLRDEISKRLIEACSGAQKTIVSYALRLALMNYSQLSSCNLFIMDEPGTALDKDHLLQFTNLLDMVKTMDKTIILVTHISELKEAVDVTFMVKKTDGFSKIC